MESHARACQEWKLRTDLCADQEVLSGHRIDVHPAGAVSPSINGVSIRECESLSAQHSGEHHRLYRTREPGKGE